MKTLMCLCGATVTAVTLVDAWLLLDAHCDADHGCPFQGRGGENPVRYADRGGLIPEKKAT